MTTNPYSTAKVANNITTVGANMVRGGGAARAAAEAVSAKVGSEALKRGVEHTTREVLHSCGPKLFNPATMIGRSAAVEASRGIAANALPLAMGAGACVFMAATPLGAVFGVTTFAYQSGAISLSTASALSCGAVLLSGYESVPSTWTEAKDFMWCVGATAGNMTSGLSSATPGDKVETTSSTRQLSSPMTEQSSSSDTDDSSTKQTLDEEVEQSSPTPWYAMFGFASRDGKNKLIAENDSAVVTSGLSCS